MLAICGCASADPNEATGEESTLWSVQEILPKTCSNHVTCGAGALCGLDNKCHASPLASANWKPVTSYTQGLSLVGGTAGAQTLRPTLAGVYRDSNEATAGLSMLSRTYTGRGPVQWKEVNGTRLRSAFDHLGYREIPLALIPQSVVKKANLHHPYVFYEKPGVFAVIDIDGATVRWQTLALANRTNTSKTGTSGWTTMKASSSTAVPRIDIGGYLLEVAK